MSGGIGRVDPFLCSVSPALSRAEAQIVSDLEQYLCVLAANLAVVISGTAALDGVRGVIVGVPLWAIEGICRYTRNARHLTLM